MSTWERLTAFWWTHWDIHPERSLLLVALAFAYGYGIAARGGPGARMARGQAGCLVLGLAVLAVAIQSPLHDLADRYLFSAHMVQHELLTLVVPPLLLLGTPGWLVRPWLRAQWLSRVGHSQLYPVIAFAGFNVLFSFLHFPTLYDVLFGDEVVHFFVHAALLLAGATTWLPLFSPVPGVLPRLALPGQMLYCFLQTIPSTLVGSLVTLSDRVIYQHYGMRPLELGVSPLADQQLGGLLMWVIGGTFFLVILTVLFFVWADEEEARG